MRYNERAMTTNPSQTAPTVSPAAQPSILQIDPQKERAAAERAAREMRMAVIIIVACMGVAVLLGMGILAAGHFGL